LQGTVEQVNGGELCIDVMGVQLPVIGNQNVGDTVKFSIKPEDIKISPEVKVGAATGIVTSILPQVGSFKITIDFQDNPIIALTYDETLVSKLRHNEDRRVSFTFKPELAVILSD